MRLACGIIAKDEELMFSKYLPNISEQFNKEIICLDFESKDNTNALASLYSTIVERHPWPNDFGKAKNMLIKVAQEKGYEWMFILDADESIPEGSISLIRQIIEQNTHDIYYFPRLGFTSENVIEGSSECFPDLQARLFKLNVGYHHREQVHTMLYKDKDEHCAWKMGYGAVIPIYIYHHVGAKPKIEQLTRIIRRDAMAKGFPRISKLEIEDNLDSFFNPVKPLKINLPK